MIEKKNLFYPYTVDNIHPGFSIDCVILSFHKKKLRILLNKFDISKYWQLPGGFMFKDESADEAAARILASRTGLTNVYLRQFHLFSDPKRTKMDQNIEYIEKNADKGRDVTNTNKWFLQRFISLGYYAFVKFDDVELVSVKEDTAKWFDVENLPALYSDHDNIIKTAKETIISLLPVIPIGYELLPEKFTMSELRKIYEIILGKTMDRRNFQRKVMSTGAIVQLDEIKSTSSYNPPILYSFDKDRKDIIDYSFY
ncbi:ADP-ribose pyrophosphatase YjhB (NUDIX family) [Dysgonomonas hofstadii]|uniref:ADP-ribose pyrophosphatase YjhB (NUDIX family) n=1 Tax=Dysgonomonas hofstadii TaxID=637886 RepID=A0A840CU87_9BACT|nr:NUDIX domain-containing protein [Dysgonomonas hofstadii]MBB4037758.1 ADP-ribose pyrophosphatase YjhB (NUDIX family) [Dysgonomonas hofstadii]